jgi:predicted SnoaL-like aldol condensation-catalyzing enzyme
MRKTILLGILLVFVTFCPSQAKDGPEYLEPVQTDEAFHPLFSAMKNGEVEKIKNYISGEMLQRNRVLLEQNKEYQDFLRKFYDGAQFKVVEVVRNGDIVVANIMIIFKDGYESEIRLQLHRDSSNLASDFISLMNQKGESLGRWRVAKDITKKLKSN